MEQLCVVAVRIDSGPLTNTGSNYNIINNVFAKYGENHLCRV